eukprot:3941925-Rhodomonas_salina.5
MGGCCLMRGADACAMQVFVPGANLSMGDMHFSQGDGEVSWIHRCVTVVLPLQDSRAVSSVV